MTESFLALAIGLLLGLGLFVLVRGVFSLVVAWLALRSRLLLKRRRLHRRSDRSLSGKSRHAHH